MRKVLAAIALALSGIAVALAVWSASNAPPVLSLAEVQVTLHWTPVPSAPANVVTLAAPMIEPPAAEALASTPPPLAQHTVVERDTLWDIAVRYGLSLDEMIAANPGIAPELLLPGDVLNIPAPGSIDLSVVPRPNAPPTPVTLQVIEVEPRAAQVATVGARLRLRREPSDQGHVMSMLSPLTPLQITARTSDDAWFRVRLPDGATGWVMAQFIGAPGDVAQIAAPTPSPQIAAAPLAAAQPLPASDLPRPEAYLRGFTDRMRAIVQAGLAQGNNPNAFALVGDSNTATTLFFDAFDRGAYNLGEYGYLEDTIRHFHGSFRMNSAAAIIGINTTRMLQPGRAKSEQCSPAESPLDCEYRLKRPSVALILIGTNDRSIWQDFERNYRPLIENTLARGIVPVLITKGDDIEITYGAPPGYMNGVIERLSQEYGVPLLDLKQAIAQFGLPNGGMQADGYHYNFPPDGRTADFTGDRLRYGFTLRNLTALQALDAVRRLILTPT